MNTMSRKGRKIVDESIDEIKYLCEEIINGYANPIAHPEKSHTVKELVEEVHDFIFDDSETFFPTMDSVFSNMVKAVLHSHYTDKQKDSTRNLQVKSKKMKNDRKKKTTVIM